MYDELTTELRSGLEEIKTLRAGQISRDSEAPLSSTAHPVAFNSPTLWAAEYMIIMQGGKSQQFVAEFFELGQSNPPSLLHLDIGQIWPHHCLPFFCQPLIQ